MLAYTLTPKSLNIYINGALRTVEASHPNFERIKVLLKDRHKAESSVDAVRESYLRGLHHLIDIPTFIALVSEGRVQVNNHVAVFNGQPINSVIGERMITHLNEGLDIRPICRFLDKLMDNPTESARDELYLWLEESKMALCDDGDFLAYKYVRPDFKSIHDGRTDHSVGNVVEMPREKCDPDRHNTCSSGLHFCSYSYIGGPPNSYRVLVLKVNPRDVVSIPEDHSNQKGRACRYTVIAEIADGKEVTLPRVVEKFGTYDKSASDKSKPKKSKVAKSKAAKSKAAKSKATQSEVPVFDAGKGSFGSQSLIDRVKVMGQREFGRKYDVPRTTLQGWLRKAQAWVSQKQRKN